MIQATFILKSIFQVAAVSILLYGSSTWTMTKRKEKNLVSNCDKDATNYIEQILEATSHKIAAVRPPTTHLVDHPN